MKRTRTKLQTHSGYRAPSEMSNRDEAIEFSDSRLWESNRRMFDVEGDERLVSEARKEPRRCVKYSPLKPFWESAGAGGEDVVTEGVDSGPLPPWLVCGPCCLTCGGGLRIIFGGGFSKVRIYCEIEDMAKVSDTM